MEEGDSTFRLIVLLAMVWGFTVFDWLRRKVRP